MTRVPILICILSVSGRLIADDQPQPEPQSAAIELTAETVAAIDAIVERGIADGEMPGAVVMAGTSDHVLLFKAYGQRQVVPDPEPMTVDTVFDLASLTKPLATATSILLLAEDEHIDLDAPVATYWPEFAAQGKESITIRDLLVHRGGLIADNALGDYLDGPELAWERIAGLTPVAARGEKFIYSDVGFLVLGHVVEQVAAQPLDVVTRERLWTPLGMNDTSYNPPSALMSRIAPTEEVDGIMLRGRVHDPRAAALGGVAGHAGLFSTANDLSRYARMILAEGELDGRRILAAESVQAMIAPVEVPRGIRGLGWDKRSPYSSNKGSTLSDAAIGHGGFTGTVLWIDPARDLYFLFLSNRLHPDGEGSVNSLAGEIATLLGRAVLADEE
jgi:CubicO group peptidase (beta-lactamase class C family)